MSTAKTNGLVVDFESYWNHTVYWLVFLAALVPVLNQSGIRELWPDSFQYLNAARWLPAFLLALMILLKSVASRHIVLHFRLIDLFFIGFMALAGFSAFYSIDPSITLARAVSLVPLYVAVFCAAWALADKSGEGAVVQVLLKAAIFIFALSLLALFVPSWSFPYYLRFRGFMGNPNSLGLLVALLLPLAFWAVRELKQKRWGVLIAVMLVSLVLSQSRLELLTTIVGTGYFLFHALPGRRLLVFVSALMLIAFNLLATQLSYELTLPPQAAPPEVLVTTTPSALVTTTPGAPVTTTPDPLVTTAPLATGPSIIETVAEQWQNNPRNIESASLSGRLVAWRFGMRYLLERPWTGFGFGTENLLYDFHGVQTNYLPFNGAYFHNSYLGLATQVGIPGALLFYMPILALAVVELRSGVRFSQSPLRFALRGVLLAGLASAFFESWLYSMGNAFAFPFWTCVMLLARFQVSPPSAS